MVRNAINAVFGLGFAPVFVATLLINHFDLFGLRQVALYLARKPYTYLEFRTPLFHPLHAASIVCGMVGRVLGHANDDGRAPSVCSAHVRLYPDGDPREERDLVVVHGSKYQDYQKRVPKLIPSLAPYRVPDERIVQVPSSAA